MFRKGDVVLVTNPPSCDRDLTGSIIMLTYYKPLGRTDQEYYGDCLSLTGRSAENDSWAEVGSNYYFPVSALERLYGPFNTAR